MIISLRPHHFLCLKGYKGHNYSNAQAKYWNLVSEILKDYPQTDIFIQKGKDDLCGNCPSEIFKNKFSCFEENVNKLDDKVKDILGIVSGTTYKFSEIKEKLYKKMTPERHKNLCSLCTWWQKGLCRDSFK